MIFSVVYNNGAKVEFESPGQAKSGNWEGIGSFGWGVSEWCASRELVAVK